MQSLSDQEANALFEEFVAKPGTTLAEWKHRLDGNTNEWIYPGLLCDSATCITGLPKAGKSLLAVSMAKAFSLGQPLLGIDPISLRDSNRVLIITSELNGVKENLGRLEDLGADLDLIAIEQCFDGEISKDAYARARYGAIDLVILDNSDGFKGGESVNSDLAADSLKAGIVPFIEAGVPVVVLHHAKSAARDGAVNAMLGSKKFAGLFRWIVAVDKINGETRRLSFSGNLDSQPPFNIKFDRSNGACRLDAEDGEGSSAVGDSKPRGNEARSKMAQLACQAPETCKSKAAVAAWVTSELASQKFFKSDGKPYAQGSVRNALGAMVESSESSLRWEDDSKRFVGA